MIVVGAQTQADEGSRVWHRLRLPAMVCLIATQRVFTGLIPFSRWIACQVMLTNERLLNFLGALGIYFLLPARHFFRRAGFSLEHVRAGD
jgi:hypothetical protein